MAKPLTAISIAALKKKPERYERPDGGCAGLLVAVHPSGKKSFVVRYRFARKPRKLTLGPVLIGTAETGTKPELGVPMTLASARVLCADALQKVASGTDPAAAKQTARQERRAAEADTLESICEEHLRREANSGLRTLVSLRAPDLRLFYPALGDVPLEQIKRAQFVRVLDQISDERGQRRAGRALGSMKTLLNWHGNRSDYVSVLTRTTWRGGSSGGSDRVLDDGELRLLWVAAEKAGTFGAFVRFTMLTACRRGEAAGLHRGELIDESTGWLIPGSRYKNKRDTLIPLSKAAQAIIASMPSDRNFVFSADGSRSLRSFADRKRSFDRLCGIENKFTIHDLRRTARTLISRAGVRPDIGEMCLGHAVGGIRGRYDRFQFRDEKAAAFEALASLIAGIVRPGDAGNVVPMKPAEKKKRART